MMLNGKIGKVYKHPFSFYFIEIFSPPPPFVYLILPNVPIPRLLGTLPPTLPSPPFTGDPRVPVIMFASTLSCFELVAPNLMNFLHSYQKDTNITILLSNLYLFCACKTTVFASSILKLGRSSLGILGKLGK